MRGLILCAGHGTRLGELTRECPKPLLNVAGKPIVARIVEHAIDCGIRDFVINLHFRPEAIPAALGDGSRFGARIRYVYEPSLLGGAGTVRAFEELFRDGLTLVHYGDVLTDHDLGALVRAHEEKDAALTMLVHERAGSNSAAFVDGEGRVRRFVERPSVAPSAEPGECGPLVFSGICVVSARCVAALPERFPLDWPRDVFPRLVGEERVFAQRLAGFRVAVDSVERLDAARARFCASGTVRAG